MEWLGSCFSHESFDMQKQPVLPVRVSCCNHLRIPELIGVLQGQLTTMNIGSSSGDHVRGLNGEGIDRK